MLSLDQCLKANRPIIFVVVQNELELLNYIYDEYDSIDNWYVYSETLSSILRLTDIIEEKFTKETKASLIIRNLDYILKKNYNEENCKFDKYIFLDCHTYIKDPQTIRKIKDILNRYQMEEEFTMNLIMVSQSICIPEELERLSEIVFFDLPDEEALRKRSDKLTKDLELSNDKAPTPEVINNLKGLTLFEVEQAYLQSHSLYGKIDINFIRNFKKSAIAKTDLLSILETDVVFDNIGGMENLKNWITKSYGGWTIEGRDFGLPLLKGLLLVGLPGTGKSLFMKAVGNEWKLPVILFDPSMLFSSILGDTENNMRRVLKIIEGMSPTILIIDEIEKAFAGLHSSGFSDSGVTARVIMKFLIWMQECTKYVFIIATANNIQYLPPELINRFDETFFVNLPQYEERKDIFSIHINRLNRDISKFDFDILSKNSKDLSGREIEQTLREAMYDAYYNKKELTTEIILEVLNKKTNLLTTMAEQLKYLLEWVGWDDEKKDGIRARYASVPPSLNMEQVHSEINNILKNIEGKSDESL